MLPFTINHILTVQRDMTRLTNFQSYRSRRNNYSGVCEDRQVFRLFAVNVMFLLDNFKTCISCNLSHSLTYEPSKNFGLRRMSDYRRGNMQQVILPRIRLNNYSLVWLSASASLCLSITLRWQYEKALLKNKWERHVGRALQRAVGRFLRDVTLSYSIEQLTRFAGMLRMSPFSGVSVIL